GLSANGLAKAPTRYGPRKMPAQGDVLQRGPVYAAMHVYGRGRNRKHERVYRSPHVYTSLLISTSFWDMQIAHLQIAADENCIPYPHSSANPEVTRLISFRNVGYSVQNNNATKNSRTQTSYLFIVRYGLISYLCNLN